MQTPFYRVNHEFDSIEVHFDGRDEFLETVPKDQMSDFKSYFKYYPNRRTDDPPFWGTKATYNSSTGVFRPAIFSFLDGLGISRAPDIGETLEEAAKVERQVKRSESREIFLEEKAAELGDQAAEAWDRASSMEGGDFSDFGYKSEKAFQKAKAGAYLQADKISKEAQEALERAKATVRYRKNMFNPITVINRVNKFEAELRSLHRSVNLLDTCGAFNPWDSRLPDEKIKEHRAFLNARIDEVENQLDYWRPIQAENMERDKESKGPRRLFTQEDFEVGDVVREGSRSPTVVLAVNPKSLLLHSGPSDHWQHAHRQKYTAITAKIGKALVMPHAPPKKKVFPTNDEQWLSAIPSIRDISAGQRKASIKDLIIKGIARDNSNDDIYFAFARTYSDNELIAVKVSRDGKVEYDSFKLLDGFRSAFLPSLDISVDYYWDSKKRFGALYKGAKEHKALSDRIDYSEAHPPEPLTYHEYQRGIKKKSKYDYVWPEDLPSPWYSPNDDDVRPKMELAKTGYLPDPTSKRFGDMPMPEGHPMPSGAKPLPLSVVEALRNATIVKTTLNIPGNEKTIFKLELSSGLSRGDYEDVDELLRSMGGVWIAAQSAHVFNDDPTDQVLQVISSGWSGVSADLDYFPTPRKLAKKVIKEADISPGMQVLEPSAGKGALVTEALKRTSNVIALEINPQFASLVTEKTGVPCAPVDFMECDFGDLRFGRIVMNPPFSRQQDVDHVTRAFGLLKPGGKLVALMSAGAEFRSNKKALAFQDLVEEHGNFEKLPEGSFKASGTGVNAVMVVLDKPDTPKKRGPTWNRNLEYNGIELIFPNKKAYSDLSDESKKDVKSAFRWSRGAGCWVSRSKHFDPYAISIAEKLGATQTDDEGQELTEKEKWERRAERAASRAEYYEEKAGDLARKSSDSYDRAHQVGERFAGGQPILVGHHSEARARKDQDRIWNSMEKGQEFADKADYYAQKSGGASNFDAIHNNPGTILRRIEKYEAEIRGYRRDIEKARKNDYGNTEEEISWYIASTKDRIKKHEEAIEYFKTLVADVKKWGPDDFVVGDLASVQGWGVCPVLSVNPKTLRLGTSPGEEHNIPYNKVLRHGGHVDLDKLVEAGTVIPRKRSKKAQNSLPTTPKEWIFRLPEKPDRVHSPENPIVRGIVWNVPNGYFILATYGTASGVYGYMFSGDGSKEWGKYCIKTNTGGLFPGFEIDYSWTKGKRLNKIPVGDLIEQLATKSKPEELPASVMSDGDISSALVYYGNMKKSPEYFHTYSEYEKQKIKARYEELRLEKTARLDAHRQAHPCDAVLEARRYAKEAEEVSPKVEDKVVYNTYQGTDRSIDHPDKGRILTIRLFPPRSWDLDHPGEISPTVKILENFGFVANGGFLELQWEFSLDAPGIEVDRSVPVDAFIAWRGLVNKGLISADPSYVSNIDKWIERGMSAPAKPSKEEWPEEDLRAYQDWAEGYDPEGSRYLDQAVQQQAADEEIVLGMLKEDASRLLDEHILDHSSTVSVSDLVPGDAVAFVDPSQKEMWGSSVLHTGEFGAIVSEDGKKLKFYEPYRGKKTHPMSILDEFSFRILPRWLRFSVDIKRGPAYNKTRYRTEVSPETGHRLRYEDGLSKRAYYDGKIGFLSVDDLSGRKWWVGNTKSSGNKSASLAADLRVHPGFRMFLDHIKNKSYSSSGACVMAASGLIELLAPPRFGRGIDQYSGEFSREKWSDGQFTPVFDDPKKPHFLHWEEGPTTFMKAINSDLGEWNLSERDQRALWERETGEPLGALEEWKRDTEGWESDPIVPDGFYDFEAARSDIDYVTEIGEDANDLTMSGPDDTDYEGHRAMISRHTNRDKVEQEREKKDFAEWRKYAGSVAKGSYTGIRDREGTAMLYVDLDGLSEDRASFYSGVLGFQSDGTKNFQPFLYKWDSDVLLTVFGDVEAGLIRMDSRSYDVLRRDAEMVELSRKESIIIKITGVNNNTLEIKNPIGSGGKTNWDRPRGLIGKPDGALLMRYTVDFDSYEGGKLLEEIAAAADSGDVVLGPDTSAFVDLHLEAFTKNLSREKMYQKAKTAWTYDLGEVQKREILERAGFEESRGALDWEHLTKAEKHAFVSELFGGKLDLDDAKKQKSREEDKPRYLLIEKAGRPAYKITNLATGDVLRGDDDPDEFAFHLVEDGSDFYTKMTARVGLDRDGTYITTTLCDEISNVLYDLGQYSMFVVDIERGSNTGRYKVPGIYKVVRNTIQKEQLLSNGAHGAERFLAGGMIEEGGEDAWGQWASAPKKREVLETTKRALKDRERMKGVPQERFDKVDRLLNGGLVPRPKRYMKDLDSPGVKNHNPVCYARLIPVGADQTSGVLFVVAVDSFAVGNPTNDFLYVIDSKMKMFKKLNWVDVCVGYIVDDDFTPMRYRDVCELTLKHSIGKGDVKKSKKPRAKRVKADAEALPGMPGRRAWISEIAVRGMAGSVDAKTTAKNLTDNYPMWERNKRRYDFKGIDTPRKDIRSVTIRGRKKVWVGGNVKPVTLRVGTGLLRKVIERSLTLAELREIGTIYLEISESAPCLIQEYSRSDHLCIISIPKKYLVGKERNKLVVDALITLGLVDALTIVTISPKTKRDGKKKRLEAICRMSRKAAVAGAKYGVL